ncbi:hypothetical protein QTN25_003630 [Entamoeba marina]
MSLPLDTEINELNAELDKLVVEYSEKRHELQPLKLHDWFMTDAKQTFHEVVGRAYGENSTSVNDIELAKKCFQKDSKILGNDPYTASYKMVSERAIGISGIELQSSMALIMLLHKCNEQAIIFMKEYGITQNPKELANKISKNYSDSIFYEDDDKFWFYLVKNDVPYFDETTDNIKILDSNETKSVDLLVMTNRIENAIEIMDHRLALPIALAALKKGYIKTCLSWNMAVVSGRVSILYLAAVARWYCKQQETDLPNDVMRLITMEEKNSVVSIK